MELIILDLTLIINKGRVYKCFGESARDSIDDICQIMVKWQEKIINEYNLKHGNGKHITYFHIYITVRCIKI